MADNNADEMVVAGFGDEWTRFDQSELSSEELNRLFEAYFRIFPWGDLPKQAIGFDLGCGSGRWAKLVAPRVGKLNLIDPSKAIDVAKANLAGIGNCEFHQASVDEIPLPDASCDFGYSLGVLHHIPDTEAGIKECVSKLKKGAPFLVYLYYRFDNRPVWFRAIWMMSEQFRKIVSRLPNGLRYLASQVIATFVYYPLARTAKLFEMLGMSVDAFPLSQYRNSSFYVMRTDALDRFGTRLEKRFTKTEITKMMIDAGLKDIRFGDEIFWTAVGTRA